MTLYRTDKRTGEMTALLAPLHHKPKGKVKRLPSPHIPARKTTYRRRHQLNGTDVLSTIALAGSGLFLAITLMALSLPG